MNSQTEKAGVKAFNGLNRKKSLFDVIRRCQDGDTKAMEEIFSDYKSPLFNLTYRYTKDLSSAEDLLQDIFIKIFTRIRKLRSPEAFNAWVYRTAINACISSIRRSGMGKHIPLDEIDKPRKAEADNTHIKLDMEKAVNILPPKQKAVFLLHDVQGFTDGEIAQVMKWSESTSKSQLFRARMKIRKYLKDKRL
ncbi:MAG: RNA polymerase sigma factor [Deltaproteobacteria bacterium]|nr:RNA polymerase sigma factor [Deltaproteobacteria bacterium]